MYIYTYTVCMHACLSVCMYVYMSVVCLSVCMSVCLYVYIYIITSVGNIANL